MKPQGRDVVEELEFYQAADLPAEAARAWFDGLDPEDRRRVWEHVLGQVELVRGAFGPLVEAFQEFGVATVEAFAAGMVEIGDG